MTNIPPETIREYYDQGVQQGVAFAVTKFKEILERMAENNLEALAEPPNQTIVQAGTALIDSAMCALLNPVCPHCQCSISHIDYLLPIDLDQWLRGKGSPYLAALVNAVLEVQNA